MVSIKRIYDRPGPDDGRRVLVDRIWPRGVSKEDAQVDWWFKEVAPTDELRRWFGHDPEKWEEFRSRYREELQGGAHLEELCRSARQGKMTLLFAAKDTQHNNAVVLKELIDRCT